MTGALRTDGNRSSLDRALAYLEEGLTGHVWADGKRLPTISRLARDAHVSTTSMHRAVGILRQRCLLTVTRKRGIFAGAKPPVPIARPHAQPLWSTLRTRLEQDILSGKYRATGHLPALCDLAREHDTSRWTASKAVDALVSDLVVTRSRRQYHIRQYGDTGSYASLLLVGTPNTNGSIDLMNDRFREFLLTLESLCRQAGIALTKFALRGSPAGRALEQDLKALRNRQDLGAIIWSNGIPGDHARRCAAVIATHGRPLVIVDENGDFRLPETIPARTPVRVLTIAARRAGQDVARFLLSCGHRRIAFFSAHHDRQWSIERLAGITDVYCKAGMGDSIRPFTFAKPPNGRVSPDIARLIERFTSLFREGLVKDLVSFRHMDVYIDVVQSFGYEPIAAAMGPLFADALRDRGITAWVTAQDVVGLMALRALDAGRVAPAARPTVIGFDDTDVAYQYNFTSYNFACADIARRAMGFVLGPRQKVWGSERRIECEGRVMQRGSVGVDGRASPASGHRASAGRAAPMV